MGLEIGGRSRGTVVADCTVEKEVSLDYDVVAAVSSTLESVVTSGLSTLDPTSPPVGEQHNLMGSVATSPARVTLFLYEVVEDPSARNRPHVQQMAPPDIVVRKPPMALLLRYMMTPWAGRLDTEYLMLARVMQTFYDKSIISGTDLAGSLQNTNEALKVSLAPITLEDRTRVWMSVQKPYRVSLTYEVRVVNLDALGAETVKAVGRRSVSASRPEDA